MSIEDDYKLGLISSDEYLKKTLILHGLALKARLNHLKQKGDLTQEEIKRWEPLFFKSELANNLYKGFRIEPEHATYKGGQTVSMPRPTMVATSDEHDISFSVNKHKSQMKNAELARQIIDSMIDLL